MIFFIVDKNATDYGSVKQPAPEAADWTGLHKQGQFKLISWNQVPGWSDPIDLLNGLLEVAQNDEVCRWMQHTSMLKLGFDPFAPESGIPRLGHQGKAKHDSEASIRKKLVFHWCNPAVGNIPSSPSDRPKEARLQFLAWKRWAIKNTLVLDEHATKAIAELFFKMPGWMENELGDGEWERERRDQVKIFHNMTEAARAFIGEVTTTIVKQIEKVFALKLSTSERLLAAQRHLISLYADAIPLSRLVHNALQDFKYFEYVNFFLNVYMPARPLEPWEFLEFVQSLLHASIDPKFDSAAYADNPGTSALQFWLRFPPTVRCAMVINLLRKLDDASSAAAPDRKVHRTPFAHRARMTIGTLPKLGINPSQQLPHYSVTIGAAPITHVPEVIPFSRAWNRAEYDITEITYRIYCCPTWAGNSGHAAEALHHFVSVLGAKAPPHTAQTIASSLFLFWRLYYDRRITPVHTLVDTFEASWNIGIADVTAAQPTEIDDPVEPVKDAWGFVQQSSPNNPGKVRSIDPIALMMSLVEKIGGGKRWPEVVGGVRDQLETERARITKAGYVIPQWSRGVDPRNVSPPQGVTSARPVYKPSSSSKL